MTDFHPIQLVAHRGYSAAAPENTVAALRAALEAGIEAVEFDVQTAACGTPVLIHDPMLGRTTNGVGPVRRRPLAQLKALDAGSWFGPEFSGERIPTLEEALETVAGRAQQVFQDIKGYREMEDLDRMVTLTRNSGLDEVTIFTSSDWVIMNRLRQVAPEIRRAYLVDAPENFPIALDRSAVDEGSILSIDLALARNIPKGLEEARDAGVKLMVWTVDDPATAEWAVEAGFHWVVTNQVRTLMGWREARG